MGKVISWTIRLIFFTGMTLVLIPLLTNGGSTRIITVDDDGEADFTKIQDAIDNATDGDIINVYGGTYTERIIITKSISLVGFPSNDSGNQYPLLQTDNNGYVIQITSDFVNISHVSIINGERGIVMDNVNYCTISNTTVKQCWIGIHLSDSSYNRIEDNQISECTSRGMLIGGSTNSIFNNSVIENRGSGIYVGRDFNFIMNNTCSHNDKHGIEISGSANNVEGNYCFSNTRCGILINGHGNDVRYNTVKMNLYGMELTNSAKGTNIVNNNFESNVRFGLYILEYLGEFVEAPYNWWGHKTGPFNNESNPKGHGENVSDLAKANPWLRSPYGSDPDEVTEDDDLPLVIFLVIIFLILLSMVSALIYFTFSGTQVKYPMKSSKELQWRLFNNRPLK